MVFRIAFTCLLLALGTGCNSERMAAPRPTGVLAPSPSSQARPKQEPATSREVATKTAPPEVTTSPVIPPEKLPDFEPEWLRALGAEGVRKLEVAASVCSAALKHDAGKLQVGCRACPPFDRATGPDGRVVVDPQEEFYEIEAVYPGSFTRTGAREAAVVMAGCEPHAGNYGGTLLVEWAGGVWLNKSYRSGFHPSECKLFGLAEARDILVCRWETDHQSHGHEMLDTYDFTLGSEEAPDTGWERVLSLDDSSYVACFDPPEQRREIVADHIRAFHIEAPKQGAPARLVVDARFSHSARTARYDAWCRELLRAMETDQRVDQRGVLNFTPRRLIFEWKGDRFEADANTRKRLRELGVGVGDSEP